MDNKETVLQKIREHQTQLKSFSIKRLGLFGSFVRNQATHDSDLDFLVEFEKKSFDNYMGLKQYLEELFNRRVDLVLTSTLKPRLRSQILKESVDAA